MGKRSRRREQVSAARKRFREARDSEQRELRSTGIKPAYYNELEDETAGSVLAGDGLKESAGGAYEVTDDWGQKKGNFRPAYSSESEDGDSEEELLLALAEDAFTDGGD